MRVRLSTAAGGLAVATYLWMAWLLFASPTGEIHYRAESGPTSVRLDCTAVNGVNDEDELVEPYEVPEADGDLDVPQDDDLKAAVDDVCERKRSRRLGRALFAAPVAAVLAAVFVVHRWAREDLVLLRRQLRREIRVLRRDMEARSGPDAEGG